VIAEYFPRSDRDQMLIEASPSCHCCLAGVTEDTQGELWQIIHRDVVCGIYQAHVMSLSTADPGFDEPSALVMLSHTHLVYTHTHSATNCVGLKQNRML